MTAPTPGPPAGPLAAREPAPPRVRRYSRLFVWTMCAAWLLNYAPYVYRLGLIALALAAGVFAALALWSTMGVPRMASLRIMLGIGGAVSGLLVLMGIGWLVIAPEILRFDSCTRSALTPKGDLQCEAEFHDAVLERYGVELP